MLGFTTSIAGMAYYISRGLCIMLHRCLAKAGRMPLIVVVAALHFTARHVVVEVAFVALW